MKNEVYPKKPLGLLVDIYDSMRIPVKKADRRPGPYPYYGASGIVDYVDSYIFDGEYLLLAEDGENLRSRNLPIAFMASGKFWVNNHAHVLKGNSYNDTRFLCYALQVANVGSYLSGSTRPKLTQGDLRRILLPCPSLPEQRAIAHILGTLDDKIELNRRMNATLEAMARALFKSWFVDFDPVWENVRRKGVGAQGREEALDQPGAPSLPEGILALFPDGFEESALGLIPRGWRVGTLSVVAELNPESWGKRTAPTEIEYVDLSNTKWGTILSTMKYAWADAPSRAQRVLRPGDTIVGTVRPGNGSYALVARYGLTGSTGFAVLRPRQSIWTEYLYLAATAPENIKRLAHLADGAAYPAVRPSFVANTTAVIPDESIINRFHQIVMPFHHKIAANEQESRTLAALRDTLLPKLISGELRVGDAERFLHKTYKEIN